MPCASNASDSELPARTRSYTSSRTDLKSGLVTRLPQDVERLDQRHAGLEQRRQLLVEDQELAGRDTARRVGSRSRPNAAPAGPLNAEDVEALFLELLPEPRLGVGGVDAFDDLAAREYRAGSGTPRVTFRVPAARRKLLSLLTLSAYGNRRIIYQPTSASATAAARSRRRGSEPDLLVRQGNAKRGLENSRYRRPASERMRVT